MLVLIIGLALLGSGSGGSGALANQDGGLADEGDTGQIPDPNDKTDSLLVAVVKSFSERIAPPKPKAKPIVKAKPILPVVKPPPKPPVVKTPPKPPEVKPTPPPPPPPKPKVPKPDFALTGTIVIGPDQGGAWVIEKGKPKARGFWIGEMIGMFKLTGVTDGQIEVAREGETFTVVVPRPKPGPAASTGKEDRTKALQSPKPGDKKPARPRPRRK